jgi:hypothetical protein
VCAAAAWVPLTEVRAGQLDPAAPGTFLPGGMLGVQLGTSWKTTKTNLSLGKLTCRRAGGGNGFDEVCFFKTSTARQVAGADVHDGFIARKGDAVVLIGTGISIKNADDPLAESVMRSFESQVHSTFQHTGADVLFVNMPEKRMSPQELEGYSQGAPVLLVQLEPAGNELAVFYGYLAQVSAFSALAAK